MKDAEADKEEEREEKRQREMGEGDQRGGCEVEESKKRGVSPREGNMLPYALN